MKIFTLRHSWPVILEAKRRESILLAMALVFAVFTACDSGSSSTDPDPVAEVSSSGGGDENLSSSSVTDKGTSSGGGSVSSSSTKHDSSSSSLGEKHSSSSNEKIGSSSDFIYCNEGDLDTVVRGVLTGFYECRNNSWELVSYVKSSSSDAHYDMTEQFYCNGYPECEYASEDFTDPRDKQVYKTLTYVFLDSGHVYRVFAENLNYGKQITKNSLNFDDNAVEKYCYNDDEWYCDNGFGGMYTWSEAMGLPKACDSLFVDSSSACKDSFVPPEGHSEKFGFYVQRQGVCPEGWHVMNGREWLRLNDVSYRGLSSSVIWQGWNSSGFSALPVGYLKDGEYVNFGEWAIFFEPEEFNVTGAKGHYITDPDHREANEYKGIAASIRCVEDYEDTLWE